MYRGIYFWCALVLCLVPAVARAESAATPNIDCESAAKPGVDFKTYWDTSRARAAAARGRSLAAAGDTIQGTATRMSSINWANVPTWSDADILSQHPLQRDVRYMTGSSNPGVQRRISWMYPDNGCFSRAEQFNVRAAAAGKTRPYKLFAFGNWLRVNTSNTASGFMEWAWHVVPVVKNSAGQPIVFDAALSPCRPLPWKKWLALMASDVNLFDTAGSNFTVSLGDSNAYYPSSLVTGEPSHSAESLTQQQQEFLNYEWTRQVSLGRDPNVVFGNSPPWSGYACVLPETESASATVAAGTTKTITATCPFATLAVGGSQGIPSGFTVSKSVKSGNGWEIAVRNNTGSSDTAQVTATCLTGAPTNAQVSSVQGNVVNINAGSYATSTAACPSGTLIGGGYNTTQGSSSIMRVYVNDRSTSTGSTWQASAYNTTATQKSITAFAYCLAGTNFSFSQNSTTVDGSGIAFVASHPKYVVGGGFSFPRTANYTPTDLYQFGTMTYIVNMDGVPSSGDANARGYAECLTHP
jgi:hypothetical protein